MQEIRDLVHGQRWAALATLDGDGRPSTSAVAYAVDEEKGVLLLLLSGLAEHSGNLVERPMASLLVGEPDPGSGNPQRLPRVSVKLETAVLPRDDEDFGRSAAVYVGRLPESEMLFGLGDFQLFRAVPVGGNYVGGFGRAKALDEEAARGLVQASD